MVPLNLPPFQYRIKKTEEKVFIFDEVRKRFVVLTPEEWVRQHFIHYMIDVLSYPRSLINVESGLVFNTLKKRSDIVVHDREGKPWMIVECKAPDQKIHDAAMRQVLVYNLTLKAKYIALTNGLTSMCGEVDIGRQETRMLDRFPDYHLAGL